MGVGDRGFGIGVYFYGSIFRLRVLRFRVYGLGFRDEDFRG